MNEEMNDTVIKPRLEKTIMATQEVLWLTYMTSSTPHRTGGGSKDTQNWRTDINFVDRGGGGKKTQTFHGRHL